MQTREAAAIPRFESFLSSCLLSRCFNETGYFYGAGHRSMTGHNNNNDNDCALGRFLYYGRMSGGDWARWGESGAQCLRQEAVGVIPFTRDLGEYNTFAGLKCFMVLFLLSRKGKGDFMAVALFV